VDLDGYVIGYWQTGDPGTPPQNEAIWFDTDATAQNVSDPSGTSFPGSPATNSKFFRTDIRGGMLFKYDGTRWLSDEAFCVNGWIDNNSTSGATVLRHPTPSDLPLYLDRWECSTLVGSANDGSNYWTISIGKRTAANANTNVISATTQSEANATWVRQGGSIAAVLATTDLVFVVDASKTGAPGVVYANVDIWYRLIAT